MPISERGKPFRGALASPFAQLQLRLDGLSLLIGPSSINLDYVANVPSNIRTLKAVSLAVAKVGDDVGAPMQRMVTDINNRRGNHPALRSPAGQITHTDPSNNVVAFKGWNNAGDVMLVVVNAGDGQWDNTQYSVSLAGDTGSWQGIFNLQAPLWRREHGLQSRLRPGFQ
jgi:hypothetical protein